jgi:dTDP-4-amino-4,6-dideoxygalactose transaminase
MDMVDSVAFTDVFVDESIVDRVTDVLRSKRYVKGPVVEQFEAAFADFCDTDHAVGVASGTDAIALALRAAGVEPGEDVLVPAHTFFATVSPVLDRGAHPVFVDVDPETQTMDPADLAVKADEATDPAAVVPVHMTGHPAAMDDIAAVAADHGLAVVEDACQAHGATYRGERVGSLGDAGCFSFYPSKNMTVAGDGGMLVTDDEALAREARMLRNHGRNDAGEHVRLGLNHRLGDVQAAVGLEQLDRLASWNRQRRAAAARYDARLADVEAVTTPTERDAATHVYHLYAVQVPDRTALQASLREAGVETGVHYDTPVHRHAAVRERLGTEPRVPESEALVDRLLSLPMHPRLDDDEIDRVCAVVETHYES